MFFILLFTVMASHPVVVASSQEQLIPVHPLCQNQSDFIYNVDAHLICIPPNSTWKPIFKNGFE